MQGAPASAADSEKLSVNKTVFMASSAISVLLILFTILFPSASEAVLGNSLRWVSDHFGWYYMLAVAAYGIFSLFVGFSRYGDIKLGQDQDKPDFPFLAWAAMLFSAGIGIDLLFFGVSEPLTHYLTPPTGTGGTSEAARAALPQAFLHWGLHGWGIYALIGMALAYFAYRKNMPLALRSALIPPLWRQARERLAGQYGRYVWGRLYFIRHCHQLGYRRIAGQCGLNPYVRHCRQQMGANRHYYHSRYRGGFVGNIRGGKRRAPFIRNLHARRHLLAVGCAVYGQYDFPAECVY